MYEEAVTALLPIFAQLLDSSETAALTLAAFACAKAIRAASHLAGLGIRLGAARSLLHGPRRRR